MVHIWRLAVIFKVCSTLIPDSPVSETVKILWIPFLNRFSSHKKEFHIWVLLHIFKGIGHIDIQTTTNSSELPISVYLHELPLMILWFCLLWSLQQFDKWILLSLPHLWYLCWYPLCILTNKNKIQISQASLPCSAASLEFYLQHNQVSKWGRGGIWMWNLQ